MLSYREVLANGGEEVPVRVNQRALIDKVLARYPGEFTLFRELLQNSDDAGSSAVEIFFETTGYKRHTEKEDVSLSTLPDLKSTPVVQWTFRNNGKPFTTHDWERLPRIAEGNPSPEKIGAFGVGFYSLFFVTEGPCVSSGGYGMQFYWKDNDDQLYVRRGNLKSNETFNPWTTFEMPLREPGPMPSASDLMRFLASSITFMVNLRDVGVFFDNHRIGQIKKSPGPSQPIGLPVEMKRSSPGKGIMHVEHLQCHCITVEAEVMDAVYACSGSKNLSSKESVGFGVKQHRGDVSRVELTVFTAEVAVSVDGTMSRELKRCLKKEPPSRLKYSLIYTGKDEYDRSSAEQHGVSIFRGLRADLEWSKHTRIFIGHATGQTTGIGGHMASHFIPTVERESIDLVNSGVSIWNRELLYIGGLLSRAVYEMELSDIRHLWEEATNGAPNSQPSLQTQDRLHRRFLHVLKFFTFHHSTPSSKVAQILRESFYQCSPSPLMLLSSVGVRASPGVRAFDRDVAKFLRSLPMLSELVSNEAVRAIEALPPPHKVSPISIRDVLQNLVGHPLGHEELVGCLRWWSNLKRHNSNLSTVDLLRVATLSGVDRAVHPLSSIKSFIDRKSLGAHIPLDGPHPASLIRPSISMHFTRAELVSFGWREFTIADWFEHISCVDVMLEDLTYDFTTSAGWAERVLCTLSLVWSSLSEQMRCVVKASFAEKHCIPTSHGLRRPDDSYLPIANDALFGSLDLPVVKLTSGFKYGGGMGIMLSFIGVQQHIPIELLSTRMLGTGDWSISDFIRYLVRLSPTLTPQDISKLKSSKLFVKEDTETEASENLYYCANELYPPVEIFRQLRLPIIERDTKLKWSNESQEAKLLYKLGLRPCPPLETMIGLCSSPNQSIRETAFTYFCDNLQSNYSEYNPDSFKDVEFIPAENKDGACLAKLSEVFLGIQWKALGFSIVQNVHRKKVAVVAMGIKEHPPPWMLLHFLKTARPANEETARKWYECFSDCIQSFTQSELATLSVVPVVLTGSSDTQEWLPPVQCYLGPSTDEFHSKLFAYVDFGAKANRFLSACGARKEPSVKDVAESLINDPDRFYKLTGGHEGFLDKLRDLAARRTNIPNDTLSRMSSQRTLLGERRESVDDQAGWKLVYELRTPREIVIVDDSRDYALFSDAIFVAPQDELLERFYSSMGSRRLSAVIQERYEDSLEVLDPETCTGVQTLVLQRLPFFLQKCPHTQYDQRRVPGLDNFSVKVCEKLLVHKSLIVGDDNNPRKQNPWAITRYIRDEGKIETWLSRDAERDIYDLAVSLCRLLFGTVKINDALLLGTMLSDLELLKQAGFHVNQTSKSLSSALPVNTKLKGSIMLGDSPSSISDPVKQRPSSQSVLTYIRHSIVDTFHTGYHVAKGTLISSSQLSNTSVDAIFLSSSTRMPRRVFPQSYIRDTVNKATEACNSRGNCLLDNQDDISQFLKFHSCNDFEQIGNLRCLGTWEDVGVHVAEEYPRIATFMTEKQGPLARFVRVISPAASAHKLSATSLHVFHDSGEGPIAFNNDGTIYLNLRYYEEWHDEDVKNGQLHKAQLSWFFVLAHEIAHNLVQTHDAAHEFWFSAICESHVEDFFAARATVSIAV